MSRPGQPKEIALQPDVVQEFLLKTSLFQDPAITFGVADRLKAYEAPEGTLLVRVGSKGSAMGILVKGRAQLASVDASTGNLHVVDSIRPGDPFGEVGPLLGAAHTHAVLAETRCVYLVVPEEVLSYLLKKVPSFSTALAKHLAMRVVRLGLAAVRGLSAESKPTVEEKPSEPLDAAPADRDTIPYVEVSDFDPTENVLHMLPQNVILQHRSLPLALDGDVLTIGMVRPRDQASRMQLQRLLHSVKLKVVAISQDDFDQALVRFRLSDTATTPGRGQGSKVINPDHLVFDVVDSEREAEKAIRVIGDEVVRVVNKIVAAGLEREASDIHIEPELKGVRVRFRINGVLQDWEEFVAPSFAKGIAARLKILSGLDITERRLPQDGRIAVTVGHREVDMRISTLPASRGEKIVLRIFEAAGMMRSLDKTFHHAALLNSIRNVLSRRTGAILVAGGTGSGKSTTLYSMLAEQRRLRPDSNVVMVEDPIEYRLEGITQVQVNHSIGLDFANVLRAILRQDPDVIALGETRDSETARISLEAAMTGHLLLTSLHANDAMASLQRLEMLGCPRELVAEAVSVTMVQRLVRRLCPVCAKAETPVPVMRESLEKRGLIEKGSRVRIPRAVGCDACGGTGYLGRVAVVESLVFNDEVREALMSGQPIHEVQRIAHETKALTTFREYAASLMARNMISGADALMAVAG